MMEIFPDITHLFHDNDMHFQHDHFMMYRNNRLLLSMRFVDVLE